MFETMRKVFGPIAVTVIIGAISLVFVFFGIYNPRTTGGRGEGALAATVNGDSISMQEFSRAYQQRTEMYSNMMKGKLDPNILKQLRVGEQVVEELIKSKLVLQEARRYGLTIADAEVREKIKEMPYFKAKDGSFDVSRYEGVLAQNRYSPATFEDMIREDLMRSRVSDFMRGRAKVSEKEVENQFLAEEDRRQVDYVVLNAESAKKMIYVSDADVDAAIKDASGLAAAKAHYDRTRMSYAKPAPKGAAAKKGVVEKPDFLPFEDVKKKVALDMVRERRGEEAMKINKELSAQLLEKAKVSDTELKAFAKSKGLEVKTTTKFNRLNNFVPGIGDMPELVDD
ncbi:MAG: SurA N-terminal domain-containing protein, partial [Deltaproteobacteria bacterium]|nr:SurA N-terminal domain-containing protein [Deltaproteobacteria bacterium]